LSVAQKLKKYPPLSLFLQPLGRWELFKKSFDHYRIVRFFVILKMTKACYIERKCITLFLLYIVPQNIDISKFFINKELTKS
jgi:hypothetical protein